MANQPVGSLWLKQHLGLSFYRLTHRSYIGTRDKIEIAPDGSVDHIYGSKYAPAEDTLLEHVEFLLKYDDLSLDFLQAVFSKVDENELIAFLAKSPTGRYTRKIGFLYEWLTGKVLNLGFEPSGNYVDLLDKESYVTGNTVKNGRWRINDNLLGGKDYCPVIRRTQALEEMIVADLKGQIDELKEEYSPEIFNRATQYLYRKETKSSYKIESEKPSPDRMNRFIAILHQAGIHPAAEVLSEDNLTFLQNAIVDPRYAQPGYRNFQNYIGQTNIRMEEIYHYVCPPPDMVHTMMQGLVALEHKTTGGPAVVRAAMIAFGFVFIHPFLDGNGRIHRFLIHDMLTRDGLAERGLIIPVSANMLNNMKNYDAALEDFSKPLMQRIQFTATSKGELNVTNPHEVAAYFRYPDLTLQSVYLGQTIQDTIRQDLFEELFFLERYDELKGDLQNLIDMPDRKLNEVIVFLHQNKGIFPNRRKKNFPEITEDEFEAMQAIYADIFKGHV
ncbi:MAG: Fic family protein [Mucilaginibacter sp.]